MMPLPIDALVPHIQALVRAGRNVVLSAEPGTGKTTRVPPALLGAVTGEVWVLEPRRLAARAAARRVAAELGEEVGARVGFAVRFERWGGPQTRLWFVTDGVLLRRLSSDPFLEGISVLVLDELHERSVESELALAMVRRVQKEVRPDLTIVAMSATLDAERVRSFLDAEVVEAPGQRHPVTVRWMPWDGSPSEGVAQAIARFSDEADGDVLAFLPGVGEIGRTHALLSSTHRVERLYGDLAAADQDRVLRPSSERRIVLATNVAESSVTVPGVRMVIDSGWEKEVRNDPTSGLDRLVETPISRASADQRAGRAGREGPGIVVRLWSEATHHARAAYRVPELQRTDLAGPVLQLLSWGEPDPMAFPWFESPSKERLAGAMALLARIGLVEEGGITALGRRVAEWPLHPRLGTALAACEDQGAGWVGCLGLALLQERDVLLSPSGVPGPSDLDARIEAVRSGRNVHAGRARSVEQVARQLEGLIHARAGRDPEAALARALLAAYPDRVCRRRDGSTDRALMVGGRGVRLHPSSVVKQALLFIALDLDDRGPEAVVFRASAVEESWLPTTQETVLGFQGGQVTATACVQYEDLVLGSHPARVDPADPRVTERLRTEALRDPVRALGLDQESTAGLVRRLAFVHHHAPDAGIASPAPTDLIEALAWGATSFSDLSARVAEAMLEGLGFQARRLLDRLAPVSLLVPSGKERALVYGDLPSEPPVLAVKIQELFGLKDTPTVCDGRVRVRLHLLAPNGRPQQVTDDLLGFWTRTWPEVRSELRGRYPKHPWPEDPLTATPTAHTKRRSGT